jgi:hypothetical protein
MSPSFLPDFFLRVSFHFLGSGLPPLSSRQNLAVIGMKASVGSTGGYCELVSIEDRTFPKGEGQTVNY